MAELKIDNVDLVRILEDNLVTSLCQDGRELMTIAGDAMGIVNIKISDNYFDNAKKYLNDTKKQCDVMLDKIDAMAQIKSMLCEIDKSEKCDEVKN